MKKNYKRIFGYGLIMVVCAMVIVLIACLSENRIEDYEEQYEEHMTLSQRQIELLDEKVKELEEENHQLKKRLEKNMSIGADVVTGQQALSDLKDIYEDYKAGRLDKARDAIKKIEPIGFDDATLSYYEILLEILK